MNAVEERKPIRLDCGVKYMTFDEVLEGFHKLVYKLAYRNCDFMEFDDACQVARLGLLDAYKDYVRINESFGAFAKAVIKQRFAMEWRKANTLKRKCPNLVYLDDIITDTDGLCYGDLIPSIDNTEDFLNSIDIVNAIKTSLSCKEIGIAQALIDGYSQKDVACLNNVHEATLNRHVKKIRQTLREALNKKESAEKADQLISM